VYQNLRVGGLASGIDTDAIVKGLMQAARAPVDHLYQQRQVLEWQQQDYREINKALLAFRERVFDMRLQSTYLARQASSDSDAVQVKATANAVPGVYELGIRRLARGITVVSAGQLAEESGESGTVTLAEQFGLAADAQISFTLQGSSQNVDGSYRSATVECLAGEATVYDLVNQINAADLGITAAYDAAQNRFAFFSPGTGEQQRLQVVADESAFLTDCLQLDLPVGAELRGENAEFTLAGAVYSTPTNSCTLLGISLTLQKAPNDWQPGDPELAVTVAVSSDAARVAEQITDFVTAYNDLLQQINAALSAERYTDYPPLTAQQKEEMSEREIELWEEKARSGLLRGDACLGRIVQELRTVMSSVVAGLDGDYDNLAAIGITTGSYRDGGRLSVDGDKLLAAAAADPQGLLDLFTKQAASAAEKGLAQRLYDCVELGISDLSALCGGTTSFALFDNSYIGRRLRELDSRIESWEERLQRVEDRYWRQFTAMEQAISTMNAQSAWLSQQFSSWQ